MSRPGLVDAEELGEGQRGYIWQSNDPLFRAMYCWHGGQWWYATLAAPYWRESTSGSETVKGTHGFTCKAPMTDALFEFGKVGA
jgi:hypothetical protein